MYFIAGFRGAPSRRGALGLFAGAAALALAACNPGSGPGIPGAKDLRIGAPAPAGQVAVADAGETIGEGAVKVALIVPLTGPNGASSVGASLRNAAKLAYADSGSSDVTILVKDDKSSPAGAAAATQAAVGEGAEIILGPVFATDVKEAGRVARAAGKPVIAFSTDTSAAGSGQYLLSFLVEGHVDRGLSYASQKGKKAVAVLAPENDYGTLALGHFQQSAANYGLRVPLIERYKPGAPAESIQRLAAARDQFDAIFIPEQADAMPSVSKELAAAGLDSKKVQIIGTGLWNDARTLNLPALQGAWFTAPENAGFNAFATRYKAKFGSDPARIATLAYDAVSLAIALSRSQGSQRYSDNVLTNPSGFNGADGVFRFKPDGTNERGLSVLEIGSGAAKIVSPAPRTFTGNGA
ncbi:penicillin-binding protein activator [Methylocystis parvus]|uniref:Penicillin-binding protein activator n=1 Tax=Methylocystis parvus TaxID=134 RepID=A0A6B8MF51_9HYPH|nr:penicillin-binding protein activator [Methylocystis parvus]QGM99300.1 penicillin-binding protein activator [Methylocystis parvus]WBK00310.1 penicillin-binding protein activator [Methylocystis parvus OBBP]